MADIADMAGEIEGEHLARSIAAARVPIAAGVAGECEKCGEDSARLVGGHCAPCRDGRTRAAPIARGARLFAAVRAAEVEISEQEDRTMVETKRQISFRATGDVLVAIEQTAAEGDGILGEAVVALIERGLAADSRPVTAAPDAADDRTPRQRMVALMDAMQALVIEQIERGDAATDTDELEEALGAAIARADAAEGKLAALKGLLS